MNWTENDLKNLQNKGFKITDNHIKPETPKPKIVKISVEKNTIEIILKQFVQQGLISGYVAEHKFLDDRKFRFDWAILDLKLAIEYEGIFSQKSRHTTIDGFTTDCEKYNLAVQEGWRVLRYTAKNYKNLEEDLEKTIENQNLNKIKG
jgi:very-short-patch-repair endonuclease